MPTKASDLPRTEARGPGAAPQSAGSQAVTPAASADPGSRIYASTCAACHESGRAVPLGGAFLPLSTAIGGESAENLVNILLNGIPAANGTAQPVMPDFGGALTDAQIVDLVRYLRSHFAQKPDWPNVDEVIHAARTARQLAMARPSPSTR